MAKSKPVNERAREAGYVYVLHFHERLADKAVHYIGCTSDPRGRLAAHAHGTSSRIMRACHVQGVTFQLGAIGHTHRRGMRRIEAQAKAWKDAGAFCEVCHGAQARAIPGTRNLPLDMLPFPTESSGYASEKPKPVTVSLTSPRTPIYIMTAMRNLSQSEKDALGFIPMGGDRGCSDYIESGNVVIALQGRTLVGYLLFGKGTADALTIQQTVVADGLRGCGIGRKMVAAVRAKHPKVSIFARVRADLEANEFWRAVGFELLTVDTHQTSGQPLNVWCQTPPNPQRPELKIADATAINEAA